MEDITRKFFDMLDKDLYNTNYHQFKEKKYILCKREEESGEIYETKKEVMKEFGVSNYMLDKALKEGRKLDGVSFEFWVDKNKKNSPKQPSTLANMYREGAKPKINVFFSVNDFETKPGYYNKIWEERKEGKIERFNAFFADIDFKLADGKTHLHYEELQKKKEEVYSKLLNLPLQPSAIVESRNGYHVYYIIDKDKRPKVTKKNIEKWEEQEAGLIKYLTENVSQYVDPVVKDITRFLRCPESIHQKKDSEPFTIKVKYVSQVYEIKALKKLFPPVKEDYNFIKEGLKKENKTDTAAEEKTVYNNTSNNEVLRNIQNQNVDYFSYIDKLNKPMGWGEALKFFKSVNLIEFLGLNVGLKKVFNSFLREDETASIAIYKKSDEDVYFCKDYALDKKYDLVDIVCIVAGLKTMENAMGFLAEIFGIELIKSSSQEKIDIESLSEGNLNVLEKVANLEGLNYISRLIPLYNKIMEVWKRETRERGFNNPWEVKLMLGRKYLSEHTNINKGNVSKLFSVMEALGILKPTKIKGELKNKRLKSVSVYYVEKLEFEKLRERARLYKEFMRGNKLNPLWGISGYTLFKFTNKLAG